MTKEFVSASRRAAALGRKHGFEIHNVNLMQQFVQPFNRSPPLLSKEATTKKKSKNFPFESIEVSLRSRSRKQTHIRSLRLGRAFSLKGDPNSAIHGPTRFFFWFVNFSFSWDLDELRSGRVFFAFNSFFRLASSSFFFFLLFEVTED